MGYTRKTGLTVGESKALVASVLGADPPKIAQWLVIALLDDGQFASQSGYDGLLAQAAFASQFATSSLLNESSR